MRHATGQQDTAQQEHKTVSCVVARKEAYKGNTHLHTLAHLRDSQQAHKSRFALVSATISGTRLSKT